MLIPIIFVGAVNGYGIIRGLAEHGIKSVLVEKKGVKTAAAVSRYVKKVYFFSDPELEKEKFLKEMLKLGREIAPNKGILFPTHDEYVITLWENQSRLSKYFEFPMSEWKTVKQLLNKKNLYLLCDSLDIPCPKTKEIDSYKEFLEIKDNFLFPVIIKPSLWDTDLIKLLGKKTLIFYDKKEADKLLERVYAELKRSAKLLIQEYIEGNIAQMPDITVFCDRKGTVKSWTAAIKLRQFPPQTGTSTMATVLSPELEMCKVTYKMTQKLVESIGFYGVCDAEYMYDMRDGKYKMIEVNTRFHMQNYMLCTSGVNMAYYIYCEHQGIPYKYNRSPKRLVSWCKPIEDKYYAIYYNKKEYPGFGMTKKQWKNTIPKDTIGIMDNYHDIQVYINYAVNIYARILSDILHHMFKIPKGMSVKQFFLKQR